MAEATRRALGAGLVAEVRSTNVGDGDFRIVPDGPSLAEGGEERRRAMYDAPWSWIRQVHESDVVHVRHPGEHAGATADALIVTVPGCPIAVTTADCAPLVLLADRGAAVVHAGWRGLMAGIIEQTAEQLGSVAGQPVAALLGPCIGPAAYEFGRSELDQVVQRYGHAVESQTSEDLPALDMTAAVGAACVAAGWSAPARPSCTSDPQWYSHRTRQDLGRQTTVVWLEEVI